MPLLFGVASRSVNHRAAYAPGGPVEEVRTVCRNSIVAPDPLTGSCDVWIHGPNGFLRHAAGSVLGAEAGVEAELGLVGDGDDPKLRLTLRKHSAKSQTVHVRGLHNAVHTFELDPHEVLVRPLNPLANHHGWYDLVVSIEEQSQFTRRFAGHFEGRPAIANRPRLSMQEALSLHQKLV